MNWQLPIDLFFCSSYGISLPAELWEKIAKLSGNRHQLGATCRSLHFLWARYNVRYIMSAADGSMRLRDPAALTEHRLCIPRIAMTDFHGQMNLEILLALCRHE